MNITSILTKKRKKGRLNEEEIKYFVDEYAKGNIHDFQATALLMAMCINGLDKDEMKYLSFYMAHSGNEIDFKDVTDCFIDKYSIGGVGDKITLILFPIIASLDIKAGKLSGKGIGIGGSTADKLLSIPGCNVDISLEEFKDKLRRYNICIAYNSAEIAPAEKNMYYLRRKNECMDDLELIAVSIMSRKLALGVDKLLINIHCGKGSIIKNYKDAQKLSRLLIDLGKSLNKEVRCVISKIYEPIGKNIGNSLEVIEAIEALKGNFEKDTKDLVYSLGTQMILMAGKAKNESIAKKMIKNAIDSGMALEKFKELIESQGGNSECINNYQLLENVKYKIEVKSDRSGYVRFLDAERIGNVAIYLGSGRKTSNDIVDNNAGIILEKKMDDYVKKDDTIAYIYTNDENKINGAKINILEAYNIGQKMFSKGSVILGTMTR